MGSKEKFAANARTAGWKLNFRLPPMPKLRESLSGRDLLTGLAAHDEALEKWRSDSERSINDRLQTAAVVTTTQQTVQAVQTVSAPASSSASPTKSLTGPATTDGLPEGKTNLYFTDARWQSDFDRFGYGRNLIGAGEIITIPLLRNAVWAGSLRVDGALVVNGLLLMLDAS